ncbi:MAG TPA: TldD/PmbA family protein, partial [Archaeoglobaceae archaeon]|nr:TldD/PmbA family protein [Archaeoglobaceae archaeon]
MDVEFFDIRCVESSNLSLTLENGLIEKPKFDYARVKGFRVLKNGFWGIFSGNVDDEEGIKKAERNSIHSGSSSILPAGDGGKFIFRAKEDPADISIEEKVNFLREVEKELKAEYIVSTRVSYMENTRKFEYRDSSGTEVYYEVLRTGVVVQAFGKDSTLQFLSKRELKPAGYEIIGDNILEIASEVRETLGELLKAKTPPSGMMNVVMNQTLGGVFIHEAFGHAVEADHVLQGSTILKDRLGEKVAHEGVNVYDDPSILEFGFCPFDDEGVKSRKKVIIKD